MRPNLRKFDLLEQKAKAAIVEHQEEYDKISKPKIEDNCLKVKGTKVYDGFTNLKFSLNKNVLK